MDEIYHELQDIKLEAKTKKQDDPYIYQQYNVKPYYHGPLASNKDVPARIVNALVDALEDNILLPRFIIIVLQDEILNHINYYKAGLRVMIGGNINWIANNICRAIDFRKKDIIRLRPGAVTPDEPKIIWTKFVSFGESAQTANVSVENKI